MQGWHGGGTGSKEERAGWCLNPEHKERQVRMVTRTSNVKIFTRDLDLMLQTSSQTTTELSE